MPKVALINILIGFLIIAVAASAGVFVANDLTYRFLEGEARIVWNDVLTAASHGHTSLFGVIQILFGVTLIYSRFPLNIKKLQTAGITLGAIAMGPGMMIRAALGPTVVMEWNGVLIGLLLSLWLIAIISHSFGIWLKIQEH